MFQFLTYWVKCGYFRSLGSEIRLGGRIVLGLLGLGLSAFDVQAESTLLNIWHKEEAASKILLEELCHKFSQLQGARLELTFVPPEELKTELMKSSLEGHLPEVVFAPSDYVGLAEALKFSVIPSDLLQSEVSPESNMTTTLQGKIYGAPILGGNHLMLFYNKRFVKQPARTWEELLAQKKALLAQNIQPIGWNYNEMYWFAAFLGAFGGWPMEGETLTLDTPAMRETLLFYKSLSDQGLIARDCDYDCAARRFFAGEFAYAINGDWAYQDAEKALGKDFGVAMIPKIGERLVIPMFSTHALMFPGDSLNGAHRELLQQFLKYMQSENVQRRWYKQVSRFPVHQKVVAQFKRYADPNRQQFLLQLEHARAMPSSSGMAFAWEGMRKGFARFMSGAMDAPQASALMQQTASQGMQAAARPAPAR